LISHLVISAGAADLKEEFRQLLKTDKESVDQAGSSWHPPLPHMPGPERCTITSARPSPFNPLCEHMPFCCAVNRAHLMPDLNLPDGSWRRYAQKIIA